jgi:hypothetical protein
MWRVPTLLGFRKPLETLWRNLQKKTVNPSGFQNPFNMGSSSLQKLFYDCTSSFFNPFYPRPHIFRICLIPWQCEAFRCPGRMSNFNFSDICIFGGNTIQTWSCNITVSGSLHTSMTEITRSCYHFSSLFCHCFYIYFLSLFCFLFLFLIRNRKQCKRIQIS